MVFFDANASFGVDMVNHECVNHERFIVLEHVDIASDAGELIGYMDRHGIIRANVWHRAMYEYDPFAGTDILIREIAPYRDRLFPSLALLPDITDVCCTPDALFEKMRKTGARTLHAFAAADRFFLDRVTMGDQLDAVCKAKIPLYLSPSTGFEYIYQVMREFPGLTVILYNIGWWPSARYVYPLLRAYPNVYFETGDFSMYGGYEQAVCKFGSERMLFGTNFPTNAMAGSIYCLESSPISDADKEKIAHLNFERLLSEVIL